MILLNILDSIKLTKEFSLLMFDIFNNAAFSACARKQQRPLVCLGSPSDTQTLTREDHNRTRGLCVDDYLLLVFFCQTSSFRLHFNVIMFPVF